jgi:hypothetical protein
VRTCDGSFFPLPYEGASGSTLEQVCQALCPNAATALYTMPFGGTIDEATASDGAHYTSLPNALRFQQSYQESCSCRRPAQSWADALSAAEAKYGRRSAHEFVVTVEASAEMSRPKADPRARAAASNDANAERITTTSAGADPGLDANGVDTKLKAAAAAVSRETSGIKDDETDAGTYLGLRRGQVVEDDDPDGGRRRVRILAPSD